MIEGVISIFVTIWSFLVSIFTNYIFIISILLFLYLMIVHNFNLIRTYTGSLIDRFKLMTGDVGVFTHTGTYHNMDYSLMIVGELNNTFSKLNYPTKATLNFDDENPNKLYKLKGETPSKFIGLLILIWVGSKIFFVPFLCKKEKSDNI